MDCSNKHNQMATYVGLYVCSEIFMYCDATARVLQKADITAYESSSAVMLLKQNFQGIRENIPSMVTEAVRKAEILKLKPPKERRNTRRWPDFDIIHNLGQ